MNSFTLNILEGENLALCYIYNWAFLSILYRGCNWVLANWVTIAIKRNEFLRDDNIVEFSNEINVGEQSKENFQIVYYIV